MLQHAPNRVLISSRIAKLRQNNLAKFLLRPQLLLSQLILILHRQRQLIQANQRLLSHHKHIIIRLLHHLNIFHRILPHTLQLTINYSYNRSISFYQFLLFKCSFFTFNKDLEQLTIICTY